MAGGQRSQSISPALFDGSRIVAADGVGKRRQATVQQGGIRLVQLSGQV